jgi:type IV pilus assembly protein PilN
VRQLPDGVYLRTIKQTNDKIQLIGYAQSNARVSTLMRNIEASPWLTKPELVEVQLVPAPGAVAGSGAKLSQFTLNLQLKRAAPPEAPRAPTAVKKQA